MLTNKIFVLNLTSGSEGGESKNKTDDKDEDEDKDKNNNNLPDQ